MGLRPIYYDTETTGVRAGKDRVIEIAAYDPVRDRTFCQFVNPEMAIPAESTAVCNITDEMVRGASTFGKVGVEFISFCEGEVVLIAHNNDAFDQPFITAEAARFNLSLPPWQYLDTLKWARKYRPDLPRHALQVLREAYGIGANQAHRALDDVRVLHELFSRMLGDLSIEMAIELMRETPGGGDKMPFGKYQGRPLAEVPKDYVAWLAKNGALERQESLRKKFQELGLIPT